MKELQTNPVLLLFRPGYAEEVVHSDLILITGIGGVLLKVIPKAPGVGVLTIHELTFCFMPALKETDYRSVV